MRSLRIEIYKVDAQDRTAEGRLFSTLNPRRQN